MLSDSSIRVLSRVQREMLVDHIDHPVEIVIHEHFAARRALMAIGLLRGHPTGATRPRLTMLTEAGRHAVGIILGDYADALGRAGLLDQERPLDVLQELRASGGAALRGGGKPSP